MITTKRRTLWDFPCHYADMVNGEPTAHCWHGRRGNCETAPKCISLPIYEQAIADNKCARLLGIFYRRFGREWNMMLRKYGKRLRALRPELPENAWGFVRHAKQSKRLLRAIRSALREAGL